MKLSEIVPEYYSKNWFVRKLFWERLKSVIRLASEKLNSGNGELNVIDLGCGDGSFLKLLEAEFPDIHTYGIDILPEVLEVKKFLRAEIKCSDLKKSGFPDNFFGVVFCLDTLEHFQSLEEPIREIKRIIKPDGLLIISAPTEKFFYKIGRFFIKGTFSMEKGPCSSPHFQNAALIEKAMRANNFQVVKKISLPRVPFFTFFSIISFRKAS